METKKAITIGVIAIIFIVTAAVFAFITAKKNSSVGSPSTAQSTKTISKVQPKAGSPQQKATQTDSDVAGIEADLNSVSEEDFSDSSLSNSAVGL